MKIIKLFAIISLTLITSSLTSCSNGNEELSVKIHNQSNWNQVFDTNRLIINVEQFLRTQMNLNENPLRLRRSNTLEVQGTTRDIQERLEYVRKSDITNTTMSGNIFQRNVNTNYTNVLGSNFNVANDMLPLNVEFHFQNGVNNIVLMFQREQVIGRTNTLPGHSVSMAVGSTVTNLASVGVDANNFRRFATLPNDTPDIIVVALNEYRIGNNFRFLVHLHVPFTFDTIINNHLRIEFDLEINGVSETFVFDRRGGDFGYPLEFFNSNSARGLFSMELQRDFPNDAVVRIATIYSIERFGLNHNFISSSNQEMYLGNGINSPFKAKNVL